MKMKYKYKHNKVQFTYLLELGDSAKSSSIRFTSLEIINLLADVAVLNPS